MTLLHKTLPNLDPSLQLASLLSFNVILQVSSTLRTPGVCAFELASPLLMLCHRLCGG